MKTQFNPRLKQQRENTKQENIKQHSSEKLLNKRKKNEEYILSLVKTKDLMRTELIYSNFM